MYILSCSLVAKILGNLTCSFKDYFSYCEFFLLNPVHRYSQNLFSSLSESDMSNRLNEGQCDGALGREESIYERGRSHELTYAEFTFLITVCCWLNDIIPTQH